MKQTDSSIIIVSNVCVLTSPSMIVYLFVTRSWSAIIGTKQPKVNQSPQQWRGRYTCTRICRFLIVGNIFRLETCMNSLVKVPPYSKLNFQGKDFFTQNWCNITLNNPLKWNSRKLIVIICKRKKIQEKNVYLNDQWKGHNKCEMMFLIQILL